MLLQKRNRRGWLEGKDSMIDWLRVPWIMGHSYLGLLKIFWMGRGYMSLGLLMAVIFGLFGWTQILSCRRVYGWARILCAISCEEPPFFGL